MGLLEALAAMSIGKLILLGVFALIIGIPVLAIVSIFLIVAPIAIISDNLPWGKKGIRGKRMMPKIRILGWGIFFIAFGAGISSAIALGMHFWGIVGLTLLFGGIGLVIFYFIAAKTEREEIFPIKEVEEEEL